jgi:hypothetical protein
VSGDGDCLAVLHGLLAAVEAVEDAHAAALDVLRPAVEAEVVRLAEGGLDPARLPAGVEDLVGACLLGDLRMAYLRRAGSRAAPALAPFPLVECGTGRLHVLNVDHGRHNTFCGQATDAGAARAWGPAPAADERPVCGLCLYAWRAALQRAGAWAEL